MTQPVKGIQEWMAERGLSTEQLRAASALDPRVLDAILQGRYTPSPQQRQKVAAALGVEPAQVAWGHTAPVEHIHGHGPQFGRSP
ncbi:MAG: helix-turn-helix transcriptional regulator [Gemmataceae bacterium]|nr:helix-turn-helix transcriptional regulator [Gemmataceae bacterium]